MPYPLFAPHGQGENRITAAILSVFEQISFKLVEQLLQALLQEPEKQILTFHGQQRAPDAAPAGRIRASFSYWIEAKTVPRAIRVEQIRAHLSALDAEPQVETQRLILLTPDIRKPNVVSYIQDERLVWASFEDLAAIIREALDLNESWLTSDRQIPSKHERELLRRLVHFLLSEGLIGRSNRQVLVVAARMALAEYQKYSAYLCQPAQPFQDCTHMAFYANGCIDHRLPAIQATIASVVLSENEVQARSDLDEQTRQRLLVLVKQLREAASSRLGHEQKVILLSPLNSPDTVLLANDIQNDLFSETGRLVPFTQSHRYLPLSSLQASPKTTSQLLELADQ